MAVFDTVRCFYKLPLNRARQWMFQTHDTPDPQMRQYIIRADGGLWRDAGERRCDASHHGALARFAVVAPRWVPVDFSGTMELSAPVGEDLWLTLVTVFDQGQLQAIDLAEESRIALGPDDWEWLSARLRSDPERTDRFEAALQRWRTLSEDRQAAQRIQAARIAVIADCLVAPCMEAGWGDVDDLRPMLQAAASSVAAAWSQCESDQDRASLLEVELTAWFGRESLERLPCASELAARVSDALQGLGLEAGEIASSPESAPPHGRWKYRVFRVQQDTSDKPSFELREVHYEGDRVEARTKTAAAPIAESVEALREVLRRMLDAAQKPVMDGKASDARLIGNETPISGAITYSLSTLQERMVSEPETVLALLAEAQSLLRDGDVKTASLLLRDMGRDIGQELLDSVRAVKSGHLG